VSDEEKEFEDSKIRRYKELEKAWDDMELDEMESKTFDEVGVVPSVPTHEVNGGFGLNVQSVASGLAMYPVMRKIAKKQFQILENNVRTS
jgi:hypothetical protein